MQRRELRAHVRPHLHCHWRLRLRQDKGTTRRCQAAFSHAVLVHTRRLATELSFEPCAQAGQVTQLAMRFVKEYVRATESDGEYYADLIDRVLPHLMALRRAALGRGTRCSMCTASCDLGISVACAGGRKRTNQQKLHDADTPLATPLGGAKTSWAVHAVRKLERRKFQVH